ncbi:MAG: hypothetical protein GF400_09975 [Candidatus Eisenbacteria bacterium]|nr:hypothetical protein [Candidatus Eisenbacteria bacterium]
MRIAKGGAGATSDAVRAARPVRLLGLLLLSAVLLASCDTVSGPGSITYRTFAMGFTPFPYARTQIAYEETWGVIVSDGDMAALHYDGGVPWEEALADTTYPTAFQDALDYAYISVPAGHVTYAAVTPISIDRNGLALRRGDVPNEPLEPPWSGYSFDHPDVIQAYKNHCVHVIEDLDPDYFAYGIEVNMLRWLSPEDWDAFVTLAADVYTNLKAAYPDLPVFLTFQADTFHDFPSSQTTAIEDVLPYTDMVAVSGYPFMDGLSDPLALRLDYFTSLADLSPDKPFAVAETAWPAEPVGDPYWLNIYADEEAQLQYLERLVEDCDYLDARFICWFFSRDYDEMWQEDLQYLPDAPVYRLWRDTGLYAGDGSSRPSLGLWLDLLALTRTAL